MLPAGKKIKTDSTSESGEECRSLARAGESPHFSLHLGDCSPEDGTGAVRSMQKGRSVASGRKRLAGYENKWARLGARGGGAGWCNPPPLRYAP